MWITQSQLRQDFVALGVEPGDTVMVHAALRSVGPVLGGPDVVITALLAAVGTTGTIMAYTDWEHGVQQLTREDAAEPTDLALLDELPPFDPRTGRAQRDNGALPELLRTTPGAVRSGNPDASMAALGRQAAWLCANHPLQYGYGPGSPLAKLVEVEGKVLLLGSPLENVTLLHYAEHLARLPDKRRIRYQEPLLVDGHRQWVTIEEFDTSDPVIAAAPDDYFGTIVREYLALGRSGAGSVGQAPSYLLAAADLVGFAVAWMEGRWGAAA